MKQDSVYSKETKILVVTEAILVRMLQSDQELQGTALIIFDEFHERSVHTDLSLALSLQVQELLRDDLKILIMSATLDSSSLCQLLGDVDVISSKGKSYDVEYVYLDAKVPQPDARSLSQVLLKTILHSLSHDTGDILVFLSSVKEILLLQSKLSAASTQDILILPLYSALSKKEQDKAILKANKRKVILSTNIAQTSLTIEGVKVVVDAGLEKLSRYNYANGMNHLETSFISKDSATQRAGRAGRLSDGKCYRIWHKSKILQASAKPEILRSDLSSLVLDLSLWGTNSFDELKFLDAPTQAITQETKETLQDLEMLDDAFNITSFGKDALKLGLHPRFAYMVLKANDLDYAYEACLLASLLGEKDIFKNESRDSDILSRFTHLLEKDLNPSYIHAFRAREILNQGSLVFKRLQKILKTTKRTSAFESEMLSVLLLFAYPDRLAKLRVKNETKYKLSNAKGAVIHQEDSLYNEEFLVVANLHAHNRDSFITQALSISLDSLEEYFSHLIKNDETIVYDKENKKFNIRQNQYFLKLELSSKPSSTSSKHDYKKLFMDLIKTNGLDILSWSKKALHLRQRVSFIRHFGYEDFVDLSEVALLASLDAWLLPYLDDSISTIKELESLDTYTMLIALLSWEQQELLNTLAPLSVEVPSGSNITINYESCEKPSLDVKIQEVFGMKESPKILNNTLALKMNLLSPAMRLTQTTYDLQSFWKNSYADVRKDLRDKYKRHYWPENPYEAVATKKTKKHMMNLDKITKEKG
ncbi:MAG: ATP-dependent helicase HrpB [Sulfurimonas sp.]|nr:ATP-dependent helicase HrpB [Sulfurimonas sp.]